MHTPRKRFGQHFLVDDSVIDAIVRAISAQSADTMVEIGPGLGALTQPLLAALSHLHVVEIDRDVIARLARSKAAQKLTIHSGDALAFDFARLTFEPASTPAAQAAAPTPRVRVVGNLPYNISTPLLFHLAQFGEALIDAHFMLQKEVVERMVAAPGSKDYGRLSVMLQIRFEMESLFEVPPDAFDPPPKVDSAIVRMLPRRAYALEDETAFSKLVTQAFSQRRKTLRNTLKGVVNEAQFSAVDIEPGRRAEELSVAEFVALSNSLEKR
jgi:16S rRNA (adenine1518-N6/adenine1519-N6)-dimethyltransferase